MVVLEWLFIGFLMFLAVLAIIYGSMVIIDDIKTDLSRRSPKHKKKKKSEAPEVQVPDKPVITKYPKIKPFTCHVCRCEYIGGPEYLRGDLFSSRFDLGINCPLCGNFNKVEFEEDTE